MSAKFLFGFVTVVGAALLPSAAFAEGAVKVECNGACNLVSVGQVCDTFSLNSTPVAISCDDTAFGSGVTVSCGNGRVCRPFGTLVRSDLVSAYCDDGGGFDAVVTCRPLGAAAANEATLSKQDDGAGEQDSKKLND